MDKQERIRIDLTNEQTNKIKEVVGQEVKALDLSVKELEERIAPVVIG
ncbi:MAG TPA: hypothetical protein VL524_05935 [Gemmatimonadaceae bacterium]|jgi:uncharacterized small protein (DUF1192 family)|nr:hypothetical protein [Gemmatimonadaceae bacterium]